MYNANGIAGFVYNGTPYVYQKNIFGDVVAIYDNTGEKVAGYRYNAFGENFIYYQVGSIGELNPFRYRGYYYDSETGLYYLQSRYYDPSMGRFLNADDVSYIEPEKTNGVNLYSYCYNNPITFVDPEGHLPNWAKWLIGGAVIVGLGIATLMTGGAAAGVAGFIVSGAFKGALVGAASGSLISGTINGIVSAQSGNSFWSGFANGAADGFMSGAIVGAVSGALTNSIKVANSARYWDKGTYKNSFASMKDHYQRKIVQKDLNNGYDIVKYTRDARGFASRNGSNFSYIQNRKGLQHAWTLNSEVFGYGWNGLYTSIGKIITFGKW